MKKTFLKIEGGRRLFGTISLLGAKNAVLPLLAGTLLSDGEVVVQNCPRISDVDNMMRLISGLGKSVEREGREIRVSGGVKNTAADAEPVRLMRSSMFMLGALLARKGEVSMPLPGGCRIGARPLDIHLDGLSKLGASVLEGDGELVLKAKKLRGEEIRMKYPSVGATENLVMCAALAEGKTVIYGAAKEPEIVSLANGLNSLGAKISGAGEDVLIIEGVESLGSGILRPCRDRIVAGTVICAVAAAGGDVSVLGADMKTLSALKDAFSKACEITPFDGGLRVESSGRGRAKDVVTSPYPGFPTDMQPQYVAFACGARGMARIKETVFENRFAYLCELEKFGAQARLVGNIAEVVGRPLHGADVAACDLRSGAGLAIAAMSAEGESRISGVQFIDRGYENFEGAFSALGAKMSRVEVED